MEADRRASTGFTPKRKTVGQRSNQRQTLGGLPSGGRRISSVGQGGGHGHGRFSKAAHRIRQVLMVPQGQRGKHQLQPLLNFVQGLDDIQKLKLNQQYNLLQAMTYEEINTDEYVMKMGEEADKYYITLFGSLGVYRPKQVEDEKALKKKKPNKRNIFRSQNVVPDTPEPEEPKPAEASSAASEDKDKQAKKRVSKSSTFARKYPPGRESTVAFAEEAAGEGAGVPTPAKEGRYSRAVPPHEADTAEQTTPRALQGEASQASEGLGEETLEAPEGSPTLPEGAPALHDADDAEQSEASDETSPSGDGGNSNWHTKASVRAVLRAKRENRIVSFSKNPDQAADLLGKPSTSAALDNADSPGPGTPDKLPADEGQQKKGSFERSPLKRPSPVFKKVQAPLILEEEEEEEEEDPMDVDNGNWEQVATLHKQQGFGDLGLMTGGKRGATIRALEPTGLLVVHKEDYIAIMKGGAIKQLQDRINFLRQRSVFSKCSEDMLIHINHYLKQLEVASGTILYNEGDPVTTVYLIKEGGVLLEVSRGQHHQRPLSSRAPLSTLCSGSFVGEVDVLLGAGTHTHTATANGELSMFAIKVADFMLWPEDVLNRLYDSAVLFSTYHSQRVNHLDTVLNTIVTKPAPHVEKPMDRVSVPTTGPNVGAHLSGAHRSVQSRQGRREPGIARDDPQGTTASLSPLASTLGASLTRPLQPPASPSPSMQGQGAVGVDEISAPPSLAIHSPPVPSYNTPYKYAYDAADLFAQVKARTTTQSAQRHSHPPHSPQPSQSPAVPPSPTPSKRFTAISQDSDPARSMLAAHTQSLPAAGFQAYTVSPLSPSQKTDYGFASVLAAAPSPAGEGPRRGPSRSLHAQMAAATDAPPSIDPAPATPPPAAAHTTRRGREQHEDIAIQSSPGVYTSDQPSAAAAQSAPEPAWKPRSEPAQEGSSEVPYPSSPGPSVRATEPEGGRPTSGALPPSIYATSPGPSRRETPAGRGQVELRAASPGARGLLRREASEPLMSINSHSATHRPAGTPLWPTHYARGSLTDRKKPLASHRLKKKLSLQALMTDSGGEGMPELRSFIPNRRPVRDDKSSAAGSPPRSGRAGLMRQASIEDYRRSDTISSDRLFEHDQTASSLVGSTLDGRGSDEKSPGIPTAFAMVGCSKAAVSVAESMKKGPLWGQRWDRKQIVTHMLENKSMTVIKEARDMGQQDGGTDEQYDRLLMAGLVTPELLKYEMLPNGDLQPKVLTKHKFQGPYGPCPSLYAKVKEKKQKNAVEGVVSVYR